MGLNITLKPEERMIVGNAVIANNGSSDCNISIENNATILREKNIMSEKNADTPCRRIYFIIQLMYVDQKKLSDQHKIYWSLIKEVANAAPSTLPLIDNINDHILHERYYQALKEAKKLMEYEEMLLSQFLDASLSASTSVGRRK